MKHTKWTVYTLCVFINFIVLYTVQKINWQSRPTNTHKQLNTGSSNTYTQLHMVDR